MIDPDPNQERAVVALLDGAARRAGDFPPPEIGSLVRRNRRRVGWRAAAAMTASAALVAGIAVAVATTRSDPVALPAATAGPQPSDLGTVPSPPTGPTPAQVARFHWEMLPNAPITPRSGAASAWSGRQLFIWGGSHGSDDGAAYDPKSRTWTELPASPLSARSDATGLWVSGRFVVWGGSTEHRTFQDGAAYDPSTKTWTALPAVPAIPRGADTDLVTVGGRALLFWSAGTKATTVHAVIWDAARNTWTLFPTLALPAGHTPDGGIVALGVGSGHALLWSYWSRTTDTSPNSAQITSGVDTFALDTAAGRWSQAPAEHPDKGTQSLNPLWTGRYVVFPDEFVWCGECSPPAPYEGNGSAVDTITGSRQRLPRSPAFLYDSSSVWTGRELLTMYTSRNITPSPVPPGSAITWTPGDQHWASVSRGRISTYYDPVVAWTGHELLVWGQPNPSWPPGWAFTG